MFRYVEQLASDIAHATENVTWPWVEKELQWDDWISDEDENKTAPIRDLEEWTGIRKEMLPPETMLVDKQLSLLLSALNKMLDAYLP